MASIGALLDQLESVPEASKLPAGSLHHHDTGAAAPHDDKSGAALDEGHLESSGEEGAEKAPATSWSRCHGSAFHVRTGPNYKSEGKKQPSDAAIYDVETVDFFTLKKKVRFVSRFLKLPEDAAPEEPSLQDVPTMLVVNVLLPSYGPGWNPLSYNTDGEGYSLVFTGKLSDEARAAFAEGKMNNAHKLLREFSRACKAGPEHYDDESPLRKRFKCIARVDNVSEANFDMATRTAIHRYNAKPFLARTSSSFYHCGKFLEVCIDVHKFTYPALVALQGVKKAISTVIFDFGFVLEGSPEDSDEELPEQMLLCCRLTKLTNEDAIVFPPELLEQADEA